MEYWDLPSGCKGENFRLLSGHVFQISVFQPCNQFRQYFKAAAQELPQRELNPVRLQHAPLPKAIKLATLLVDEEYSRFVKNSQNL